MKRLLENKWEDISCVTYETYVKHFDNFKMVVMRHNTSTEWTLSLEDTIDANSLYMDEPDEVIISIHTNYDFVVEFDSLMSKMCNDIDEKEYNIRTSMLTMTGEQWDKLTKIKENNILNVTVKGFYDIIGICGFNTAMYNDEEKEFSEKLYEYNKKIKEWNN